MRLILILIDATLFKADKIKIFLVKSKGNFNTLISVNASLYSVFQITLNLNSTRIKEDVNDLTTAILCFL